MGVTKEEIRTHLLSPVQRNDMENDADCEVTNVLALWCQHWEEKLSKMSKEERRTFLDKKQPKSSWHFIVEIIEEEEAGGV